MKNKNKDVASIFGGSTSTTSKRQRTSDSHKVSPTLPAGGGTKNLGTSTNQLSRTTSIPQVIKVKNVAKENQPWSSTIIPIHEVGGSFIAAEEDIGAYYPHPNILHDGRRVNKVDFALADRAIALDLADALMLPKDKEGLGQQTTNDLRMKGFHHLIAVSICFSYPLSF